MTASSPIPLLTELAGVLHGRPGFEQLLKAISETAAALLRTPYVSVRLLDPSGERLLAVCRAGQAMHEDPDRAFQIGEGLLGTVVASSTTIRTGDATGDPRYVSHPHMREPLHSFLGVPLVAGRGCLGVLSAGSTLPDAFSDEDEQWARLLAAICAPYLEIARLERLAFLDPLTGALNRRGIQRAIPAIGVDGGAAVIMVDLDHFKALNDTHGHALGDQVLREVGRILHSAVRQGDAVIRYGGEEFLLVLYRVDEEMAAGIAERTRAEIAASRVDFAGEDLRITASFGVALSRPGEARELLLKRADQALYAAKHAGRDRVTRAK